jgi:hypothetical protein
VVQREGLRLANLKESERCADTNKDSGDKATKMQTKLCGHCGAGGILHLLHVAITFMVVGRAGPISQLACLVHIVLQAGIADGCAVNVWCENNPPHIEGCGASRSPW